ncbi:hypothetical protein IQ260_16570 [Leptolyngbya cf. ectocarpi LEGE 11479]|uniref:Uncharacterized protein n=1 Tax=Leptolyngbya cf. ectocarpi LEGE 11479 TaxID=1828722 RepID=A0A928ZVJ0_LEPEC|nr:hypothetical protein [Leptolyngbya ectocarpi]MBE9068267.1 hypothetical protein [Leptolyngbya cf. ectocarpi LEGE 11479]
MTLRILLASFFCGLFMVPVAQAQMANVPNFDTNGDFLSARVQGNRGTYPHWQWVVVETDAAGLNCRTANGVVAVTLAYGAVVDSVFDTEDAIELVDGQPWLKVTANVFDLNRRVVGERAVSYSCYVRANTQYIAPVNPDTR